MKNNQKSYRVLYSLILAMVWLCVSCSHTKSHRAGLEGGLAADNAEEVSQTTDSVSPKAEEATPKGEEASLTPIDAPAAQEEGQEASVVPAEESAPAEELASEEVEPQEEVAVAEEAPEVTEELSAASAAPEEAPKPEVVALAETSPVQLDGSEAGFLATNPSTEAEAVPAESKAEELLTPPSTLIPAEEKTAPRKPAQRKATSKQTAKVAHSVSVAKADIKSELEKALGEDEPAIALAQAPAPVEMAVANVEEPKKEQLASVEMGSFFERHIFGLAVALVGCFAAVFLFMKRDSNKDLPL